MSDELALSVVVCSHNGAKKLVPCFEALLRQRVPVPVLVIDDGSTDGTGMLAQTFGFAVIRHDRNRGVSAARNTGLMNATTPLVAFCDDDCTPPDDWTEQLLAAWNAHPDVTILGGLVEVADPISFTQKYLEFRNPLVPPEIALAHRPSVWYRFARQFRPPVIPSSDAVPVYSVVGANMSMQRVQALSVGGFDENLVFGEGEEMALCAAVRASYGEPAVVVDPSVALGHRFDPSMSQTWRRSFAYGQGSGERWRKIHGWPSLPVVGPTAVVAAAVVAPFSWLWALVVGLVILAIPCTLWAVQDRAHRHLAVLTYPFVALADDAVSLAGFLRGAFGRRGSHRALQSLVSRWPRSKEEWYVVKPSGRCLILTLILSVALALAHSPLAPLPGVVTIFILPGASVLAALKTRPANTSGRVILAVCLSMIVIMVVGAVASLLGPHVGVAHPLDTVPEGIIWFVLALVVLTLGAAQRTDPLTWIFDDVRIGNYYGTIAGSVLVLLAILGAAQLNHSGNNFLSVFTTGLAVLALIAGVAGGWKRNSTWPLCTLLYCASLALLLTSSLRGGHLDGWDIQQEFGVAFRTAHAGVWTVPANHDPYASMLSLTVLPAILHSLVKLRLLAFFQLVVPAILALLPVAVFSTIRRVPRWVTYGRLAPRPGLAFGITVGLIVSSVAFSSQLVGITRQAMALTLMTALVMVLFDRTMVKRSAQIVVGILIVGISFTHYTTSYLLAAIVLCAWVASLLWSRGSLGTPKASVVQHRSDVHSRRILNSVLVVVALSAAFGWNLAITRNSALTLPVSAITQKGIGIAAASGTSYVGPRELEPVLEHELKKQDGWIIPVAHARSVKLTQISGVQSPGVAPSLLGTWTEVSYLFVESIWIVLGVALLYGLFRLGRRRSYSYSADLVGLAVAGLMVGAILRFSGTLAAFYNPERAAIFTAILLAAPVTLFLDDLVGLSQEFRLLRDERVTRTVPVVGVVFLTLLLFGSTGLAALFFGGVPPQSLVAKGLNVQDFTVSTPEVATAIWLRNHVHTGGTVQTDLYGHLVLLSEPGTYNVLFEIVPAGVDRGAYIYLSTVNLAEHTSQFSAENGNFIALYRSNTEFFNHNFHVVYSTGATRVYH
ncbi:MAG: glycosyltransferase [Acidimicrobiales bacterium]